MGWPFDGHVDLTDVPPKVRRFAPTDRHITSVFLGAVDQATAERAWSLVTALPMLTPQTVSLDSVRLLGGKKPSAVSALVTDGDQITRQMHMHRRELVREGILRNDRPDYAPLPHVTLARIQRSADGAQYDAAVKWANALEIRASARIDRLALYTWSEDRSQTLFVIKANLSL